MITVDENALVCDFAETYQVFDYKSLPARFAATLAAGLRENSRIKMKMSGMPCSNEMLMLAMAVDRLSMLLWAKTEDGQKNRNRPESIYMRILGLNEKQESDVVAFASGSDFEAERQRLISGGDSDGE